MKDIRVIEYSPHSLYQMRGVGLLTAKDYEGARLMLTKSLENQANNVNSLCNLGLAYKGLGNYDLALIQFLKASRIRRDDDEIYVYIGNTMSLMGNPDIAACLYDQALRLRQDNYDAHYNKGLVIFHRGDNVLTGMVLFESSDKIKEGDPLVNFYIGVSYLNLNDIYSCHCYFRRTIRFSGRNQVYYVKICEYLVKESQYKLASFYCNEGLRGDNHPTSRRLQELKAIIDANAI